MKLDYVFNPAIVNKILYVTHKGKQKDFWHPSHSHRKGVYEIIFIDYGELRLEFDRKELILSPGECIFISGDLKHSFSGRDGVHFNFMNIMFKGQIPPELADTPFKVFRDGYNIMDKIMRESTQRMANSNELTACYLTEFIVKMIRQVTTPVPPNIPQTINLQHYQSEIVRRAMSVISHEYSSPLSLKKLSQSLGVSESHLRVLIKKETGKNYTSILHSQRIAIAKHLLSESNLSTEEIVSAVGYSSVPFFFKVFKRLTGMTPKAYASSLGDIENSNEKR